MAEPVSKQPKQGDNGPNDKGGGTIHKPAPSPKK